MNKVVLKLSSFDAQAVLFNLQDKPCGHEFNLPTMFPGVPGHTQCRVVSLPGSHWSVQLIALGVPFALLSVYKRHDEVILEVEK